jgi:hypothetical protein
MNATAGAARFETPLTIDALLRALTKAPGMPIFDPYRRPSAARADAVTTSIDWWRCAARGSPQAQATKGRIRPSAIAPRAPR